MHQYGNMTNCAAVSTSVTFYLPSPRSFGPCVRWWRKQPQSREQAVDPLYLIAANRSFELCHPNINYLEKSHIT